MTDNGQLLRDYVERRDENAFGELVKRHIDLVYSTALRRLGGDAHVAQDITQMVFTDLARKAKTMPRDVVLGGWLYRHTRFTAAKALRAERRRQIREREAAAMNAFNNDEHTEVWRQVAPALDEAMSGLGEHDRNAVVLRFFERRPLREVGVVLGSSEDAARMRVDRALEKLRKFLTRRGVTLSAAALATVLNGEAVVTAPVGLAASVTGAALAGAAGGTGTTLTLLKLMAMTKLKAGVVSAVVVAALATLTVVQHRTLTKLRDENAALRERTKQLDQLRAENQQWMKLKVDADELQRLRAEHAELMRLRGQVGLLGRQAQQAGKETVPAEETPKASRPLRLNEYLARKEWADAGGESPEAALQTLFWALSVTNLNRAAALIKWDMNAAKELLPPLDPITRASRIDDIPAFMQDAVSRMSESVAKLAGLRLVSSKTNTEGQAVLGFEAPGEDGKSTEGSLRFFRTVSGQWGPLMKVRNVEGAIALDWAEPEAEH